MRPLRCFNASDADEAAYMRSEPPDYEPDFKLKYAQLLHGHTAPNEELS
jgi:hypothetical protein